MAEGVRPLRRVEPGVWKSRDGRWTFLRHQSDPHPQRWFTYDGGDTYPADDAGALSLREAAGGIDDLIRGECEDCHGRGERVLNGDWPSGEEPHSEKCPSCGGSGRADG